MFCCASFTHFDIHWCKTPISSCLLRFEANKYVANHKIGHFSAKVTWSCLLFTFGVREDEYHPCVCVCILLHAFSTDPNLRIDYFTVTLHSTHGRQFACHESCARDCHGPLKRLSCVPIMHCSLHRIHCRWSLLHCTLRPINHLRVMLATWRLISHWSSYSRQARTV